MKTSYAVKLEDSDGNQVMLSCKCAKWTVQDIEKLAHDMGYIVVGIRRI